MAEIQVSVYIKNYIFLIYFLGHKLNYAAIM